MAYPQHRSDWGLFMAKKKGDSPKPRPKASPKKPSPRKSKATASDDPGSLPLDPRAIEGLMWGQVGSRDDGSAVSRAQEVMYDAFEESDPKKRVKLARKALAISADCA